MTDDEIKFKEFCLKMYHANNKERKAYGEKQYDNFKMYYKYYCFNIHLLSYSLGL